jgi:hypothetical protein
MRVWMHMNVLMYERTCVGSSRSSSGNSGNSGIRNTIFDTNVFRRIPVEQRKVEALVRKFNEKMPGAVPLDPSTASTWYDPSACVTHHNVHTHVHLSRLRSHTRTHSL